MAMYISTFIEQENWINGKRYVSIACKCKKSAGIWNDKERRNFSTIEKISICHLQDTVAIADKL